MIAAIDELIALFNARSMDVPDGLFSRRTQFVLNGVSFEETLGRSSNDPLVLMLTRGAAGYRFAVKALQHALPDAVLQRGELALASVDEGDRLTGQCWVSGHLRGHGAAFEAIATISATTRERALERVEVLLDDECLRRLRTARAEP